MDLQGQKLNPSAEKQTTGPALSVGSGFSLGFVDATIGEGSRSGGGTDDGADRGPGTGGYILQQLIGVGGQGEVWEAWQPALQRTVAVKIHHRGAMDRFAREALLTGALEHPSIVPVLDFGRLLGENGGSSAVAMAMKRLRGSRWDQLIARDHASGDLPTPAGLQRHFAILEAVCQAVSFAHSRGILHLDLKPSQVIVGEFGETYLCDWGMAARMRDGNAGLEFVTQPNGPFGTPGCMAPEQALGDVEAVGVATDVYLIAGLIFHVLSGGSPHRADSTSATTAAARRNDLAALPEWVPNQLREVVLRGLSSRPADRHPSVDRLREELASAIRHMDQASEAQKLCGEAKLWLELDANPDYGGFTSVEQKLERALALCPDEPETRRVRDEALRRHMAVALGTGDLALARVVAERMLGVAEKAAALADVNAAREAADAREWQHARARRNAFRAVSALALVLVVSSIALYIAFQRAAGERSRAEAALLDSRRELARASIQAAMSHLDKLRPSDAREALIKVPEDMRGWEWGYLASRAVPESRLLVPREFKLAGLVVSTDASVYAAIAEDKTWLFVGSATGHFHDFSTWSASGEQRTDADTSAPSEIWSALGQGRDGEILAGTERGRIAVFRGKESPAWAEVSDDPIVGVAGTRAGIVYATDGRGQFWRVDTVATRLLDVAEPITVLEVSDAGYAVGTSSGAVWHGQHGSEPVMSPERHTAPVIGLRWHPSQPWVASWAGDARQSVYTDSRAIIHRAGVSAPIHITLRAEPALTALDWSPDGQLLMTAFSNTWLHEVSTERWSVVRSSHHGVGIASALHYIDGGKRLLLLSRALLQVRETQWLGQEEVLRADSRQIHQSRLVNSRLYTVGEDGGLGEWHLGLRPDMPSFEIGPDRVLALETRGAPPAVAAAHRWGWLFQWRMADWPAKVEPGISMDGEIVRVGLASDGERFVALTANNRLHFGRFPVNAPVRSVSPPGQVVAMAMHPHGDYAAVTVDSGGAYLVSAFGGHATRRISEGGGPWINVEFSRKGDLLFCARENGTVDMLSSTDARLVAQLAGHSAAVLRLWPDDKDDFLVTASADESAALWDLRNMARIGVYTGTHAGAVVGAMMTGDGKRVITACEDGLLRVFDRDTEYELATFDADQFGVVDIAMHADRMNTVVTTGLDTRIRFWRPLPWTMGDGVLYQDPAEYRPVTPGIVAP